LYLNSLILAFLTLTTNSNLVDLDFKINYLMNLKTIFVLVLAVFCTSNLITFYLHSHASSEDKEQPSSTISLYFIPSKPTFLDFSTQNPLFKDFSPHPTDLSHGLDQGISNAILREYLRNKKLNHSSETSNFAIKEKIYEKPDYIQGTVKQEEFLRRKEAKKESSNLKETQPLNNSRAVTLQKVLELNPYKKLGLYETMPLKYYNAGPGSKLFKVTRYYGINKDNHYCEKVDLYNLFHPNNIFDNIKFISDYAADGNISPLINKLTLLEGLVRKFVMPRFGPDVLPKLRFTMPLSNYKKSLFNFPMNATMYFFKRVMVHHYYEANKQIMCKVSFIIAV